jgi:catechol 2,3-dioxygenase-like lactoylglutathione lyase family enzyme
MGDTLTLGPVHHITLRVAQLDRSIAFYQGLCGCRIVAALSYGTILSNGKVILGLCEQPCAGSQDRFDEFRVGLDHLSFTVDSRAELASAPSPSSISIRCHMAILRTWDVSLDCMSWRSATRTISRSN